VPASELVRRFEELRALVLDVLSQISAGRLNLEFGDPSMGRDMSTRQAVMSLLVHFNYHRGQMDYLLRVLTGESALPLAQLD
jgi:uncharacterized damage-inducible protein DinB